MGWKTESEGADAEYLGSRFPLLSCEAEPEFLAQIAARTDLAWLREAIHDRQVVVTGPVRRATIGRWPALWAELSRPEIPGDGLSYRDPRAVVAVLVSSGSAGLVAVHLRSPPAPE